MTLCGLSLMLYALTIRHKVHAKTTVTRMRDLMTLLKAEQPDKLDADSLTLILQKYNRSPISLKDGWGRPLIVERRTDHTGKSKYLVISLGRDGKRGACCQRRVPGDWDADAVLLDDEWLQVWW